MIWRGNANDSDNLGRKNKGGAQVALLRLVRGAHRRGAAVQKVEIF